MMQSKKEAVAILSEAFEQELGSFFSQHGFDRVKNSLDYARACKDGSQLLLMGFEFEPKYQPGADGRISPTVRIFFPEVNRVGLEMVEGDSWLLADAQTVTFFQPIDFTIPKDRQVRWFTYGRESVLDTVRSIRSAFESWVVPFLDEYRSVDSLIAAYKKHDERFLWQRHFYIYVAAAYILLGEPERAKQVLEDKLGKPGSRQKYAKAFEYVANRLEKA